MGHRVVPCPNSARAAASEGGLRGRSTANDVAAVMVPFLAQVAGRERTAGDPGADGFGCGGSQIVSGEPDSLTGAV